MARIENAKSLKYFLEDIIDQLDFPICSTAGRIDDEKIDELKKNILTMFCSDKEKASKAGWMIDKQFPTDIHYKINVSQNGLAYIYMAVEEDPPYLTKVGQVPARTLNKYALNFLEFDSQDN